MTAIESLVATYRERTGREVAVGDWMTVTQDRIDDFARITGDEQWIHVDPRRAEKESPFGKTIAHGFLTLALLPKLTGSNTPEYFESHYPGMSRRINYGLDRVRFPAPVPVGSRIRARTTVEDAEDIGDGVEIKYVFTVEIEGREKPGCVAEQVFRLYPE